MIFEKNLNWFDSFNFSRKFFLSISYKIWLIILLWHFLCQRVAFFCLSMMQKSLKKSWSSYWNLLIFHIGVPIFPIKYKWENKRSHIFNTDWNKVWKQENIFWTKNTIFIKSCRKVQWHIDRKSTSRIQNIWFYYLKNFSSRTINRWFQ